MQKDEKGNVIYDENIAKRINAISISASNQFTKQ
jgi:hypothetical protein